ncbi:MAG: hypothetical protein J3K34DRAFT_439035 [Monoraphidium minutum]|nr:MAG: hypothetical protein J3K34DRAFT_439035 [Monoraphidium minutum]
MAAAAPQPGVRRGRGRERRAADRQLRQVVPRRVPRLRHDACVAAIVRRRGDDRRQRGGGERGAARAREPHRRERRAQLVRLQRRQQPHRLVLQHRLQRRDGGALAAAAVGEPRRVQAPARAQPVLGVGKGQVYEVPRLEVALHLQGTRCEDLREPPVLVLPGARKRPRQRADLAAGHPARLRRRGLRQQRPQQAAVGGAGAGFARRL